MYLHEMETIFWQFIEQSLWKKGHEGQRCCDMPTLRLREGRREGDWWRVNHLPFALTSPLLVLRMAMDSERRERRRKRHSEMLRKGRKESPVVIKLPDWNLTPWSITV